MKYKKPERIFEAAGSVNPKEAYYTRLNNVSNSFKQDIKTMVDKGRYFSIFAPRQSGKTTFLKRFCQELEKDRTYIAILLNFEKYIDLSTERFYQRIQKHLYMQLNERLTTLDCDKMDEISSFLNSHELTDHISFSDLFEELNRIIRFKKIIIFIDEFDGIPQAELGNFLRTIRDLYLRYKEAEKKALYSVGLVGIRNITKLIVGGISPFNIADQVEMPSFSLKNVHDLFSQYTEETNQPFSEDAVNKVHEETGGQTWLVNRLGTILTVEVKPGTVEPIDETDVERAIDILLLENNVHFDNLYQKAVLFKETFVKIVFDHVKYKPNDEDQSWLEQYGLVKKEGKRITAGNNIYKKRFIEIFFDEIEALDELLPSRYFLPGNRLDMETALLDFEKYITQTGVSAFYQEKKPYEKTGQFLLTAWLHQFEKGGDGDVRYEVYSGLGRMDILLTYKGKKYIIETKVNRHNDVQGIMNDGIIQLSEKYLASEKTAEGYLVIFDTKTNVGANCKVQHHNAGNKKITSFIIAIGKTARLKTNTRKKKKKKKHS